MSKTSYTIPEVAGICHVSEKLVISWGNQGKLKISKVNLENCVYREDLILFMRRVGFSTEALAEDSPVKSSPITVGEIKKAIAQNRGGVANMVLATLRNVRDNSPKEWDALMKTESGPVIASLWDYLRGVQDEVVFPYDEKVTKV